MADKTVRLRKPPSVTTDDRGQRVWSAPIEPAEFELVSTVELQRILDSDSEARHKIENAVECEENPDAVLAHDAENDQYEFIDAEGSEEFSLVSTQMLFKILARENGTDKPVNDEIAADEDLDDGGFDPYNCS